VSASGRRLKATVDRPFPGKLPGYCLTCEEIAPYAQGDVTWEESDRLLRQLEAARTSRSCGAQDELPASEARFR
jgi:hypothetical protein